MVQCDGVDNRRAKSDAVPTLLERKRRDMEVKVVMTGTTVQGHDTVPLFFQYRHSATPPVIEVVTSGVI